MTWVVVLVIVAGVAAAPLIRRLRAGNRLITSLLTGQLDNSLVGQRFTKWFTARPAREEQRRLFVQICLAMGGPSGVVADRLMDSIMRTWGDQSVRFGDTLAQELERLISFNPRTPEQVRFKDEGLEALNQIKAKLRSLDS